MGATEDLVNSTQGAAECQENRTTGPSENPIKDNTSSTSENLVQYKALDAENPVSDQQGGAEIPETGGAENPASDQKNVEQIPASEQVGIAENMVNDQAGGAEDPTKDRTAGGAENPLNDLIFLAQNPESEQAGSVENLLSNQAGVAEDHTKNRAAGSAENPSNDLIDLAQNPESEQAGSEENLLNYQAGGVENSAKNHAAAGAGDPPNDQAADGAENSAKNLSARSAGDPPHDQAADAIENSLNNQTEATEKLVKDEQGTAESFVEDVADAVEMPENSQRNGVETPVSNKADRLPEEAKEILKSLASKWEDVLDANALQVIPLKGAMTNEVFQIKWPTMTGELSRKVLVRMYGEGVDVFFDRDNEIHTFEFMSKNGQGPRLLGRFTNGRVEEFIHARTLSASDLRDPSISALIAAKMKEFHDLDMPGEKKVHLWDRLRNWLSEAKRLSSPKEVEAFYLDTIDKEISILEKELSGSHQQIKFCHNDLQYGNIMLDEETNSVTIIDYEYASYNPVAFDIANHFCEMAANYHTEEPHILDYNKYPDFEERQRFVQAYLSTSGEQPSDSEVEQLLQEIEKYTLANHLFWGVWGIISAQVNTIDFDYKEYAKQRFQEYWARKPYLLINSEAPSPYNVPEGTGELASAVPTKSKNSGIFRKMKRVLGLGLFRSKS
ncbi:probable choline kinase 2 isoform X1 [Glycine soja]|uniref:Choline/ethanolamine kinase n=1 Tax=Glycine soja TaxID=3848 RepID=A0A0B2PSK3_GLYSO|nr:probable choline kinase 2 isoform X1 [Glycine soja]KHN12316.1 Choline/ethanolamine kinase [Glycine soja]